MINEKLCKYNPCEKESRKIGFLSKCSKTSSGNVLGTLFWRLTMVRKYAKFGLGSHEYDHGK